MSLLGLRVVSRLQPVYNLRVQGSPEFFANGILVHNCDALSGAFNAILMLRGPVRTGSIRSPLSELG